MFKVTTSGSRLRVRSGPGLNYAVLGSLANGQTVNVIEVRGDWARIGPGWWSHRGFMKNMGASSAAGAGAGSTAAPPASPAPQAGLSDILYDAINAFKYSRTGLGRRNPGGDAAYNQRYRTLARQAIEKLWRLRTANEIGFENYPWDASTKYLFGTAHAGRSGFDIRTNDVFEPDVTDYGSATNQEKLAFASLNMVHEALHLIIPWTVINEEVLARRMQCMYYQDLLTGRRYKSAVTGDYETIRITGSGSSDTRKAKNIYDARVARDRNEKTIDSLCKMDSYRGSITSQFIRRSITWWGGISNRDLSTMAIYINVLAKEKDGQDAVLLLEMLDRFPSDQSWNAQQSWIDSGTVDGIKESIKKANLYYLRVWVQTIEQRLGINLL